MKHKKGHHRAHPDKSRLFFGGTLVGDGGGAQSNTQGVFWRCFWFILKICSHRARLNPRCLKSLETRDPRHLLWKGGSFLTYSWSFLCLQAMRKKFPPPPKKKRKWNEWTLIEWHCRTIVCCFQKLSGLTESFVIFWRKVGALTALIVL